MQAQQSQLSLQFRRTLRTFHFSPSPDPKSLHSSISRSYSIGPSQAHTTSPHTQKFDLHVPTTAHAVELFPLIFATPSNSVCRRATSNHTTAAIVLTLVELLLSCDVTFSPNSQTPRYKHIFHCDSVPLLAFYASIHHFKSYSRPHTYIHCCRDDLFHLLKHQLIGKVSSITQVIKNSRHTNHTLFSTHALSNFPRSHPRTIKVCATSLTAHSFRLHCLIFYI